VELRIPKMCGSLDRQRGNQQSRQECRKGQKGDENKVQTSLGLRLVEGTYGLPIPETEGSDTASQNERATAEVCGKRRRALI
jgi:hypothetical protein